jgi:cyclopropane-fatty-acyl-phospholipid synthase
MPHSNLRNKITQYLSTADIEINGDRPWDIRVHNNKFYSKVLANGALAMGESYIAGWWDCDRLDELFYRILLAELDKRVVTWREIPEILKSRLLNLQSISRAFQVGKRHYDIGNNLYKLMLDKRMIYSCGYWETATTLDEAQEAKLDLICRKLELQPGMRILDIGCGWGGAARYAAEQYNVEVVGLTVSEQQAKFAREYCRDLPVEIRLQDYRSLDSTFDRIFSVGMFEHVGYKNYGNFFQVVNRCLARNGLFLLHTIGNNCSTTRSNPWITRYIFPNSMVPSARQICDGIEGLFVLEDWHSFGAYYDKTLMTWYRNFQEHWDAVKNDYDKLFYRTWKYYLLSCAGSFRARKTQVWQIVLSTHGVPGVYSSIR